ncbi:MAG TPA: tRNA lysidine(34) synthetase TilS, partial [Anaerolineae bacterium]|nr:tRNA lysidine(34) synthetase TilS [Anaerolineae bacterium]
MTLLKKLRSTITEHQLINQGDALVVGVSGGPDSLALLHALRALAPEFELTLHVAHLNHQLRGDESDADEAFVLSIAREWELPAASARWDVRGYAEENHLSIEEAARSLRYQFLLGAAAQVGAQAIAVAHNADDQVETILLHFLRGAGLSGLRGMEYKTLLWADDISRTFELIRPFLDIPRAEIEAYCIENNVQPRIDQSNFDTTILRNRLRLEVIPYLEKINPNFREVVRHSTRALADDYAYINQNVIGIFDRMTRTENGAFIFDRKWFRALPINLQRGVLREALTRLHRIKYVGWVQIENARQVAAEKNAGAEATLPQGLRLVVGYDDFTIGEALPLPDAPLLLNGESISLNIGDAIPLPNSDWSVKATLIRPPSSVVRRPSSVALLDSAKLCAPLTLRPRRAGDRFAPS